MGSDSSNNAHPIRNSGINSVSMDIWRYIQRNSIPIPLKSMDVNVPSSVIINVPIQKQLQEEIFRWRHPSSPSYIKWLLIRFIEVQIESEASHQFCKVALTTTGYQSINYWSFQKSKSEKDIGIKNEWIKRHCRFVFRSNETTRPVYFQ